MIAIILEMWKHRDEVTFKYIKVDSKKKNLLYDTNVCMDIDEI